jgi:hypothetical protein
MRGYSLIANSDAVAPLAARLGQHVLARLATEGLVDPTHS